MADSRTGEKKPERVLVIGDGSWGTTLALLLVRNGIPCTLWSAFPDQAAEMQQKRENERFLPGHTLPSGMTITADPHRAAEKVDLVVSVVPTQYLRSVLHRFEDAIPGKVPIVTATKGLEIESFKTPSQILAE